MVGRTLGRYEISKPLGAGSVCKVCWAKCTAIFGHRGHFHTLAVLCMLLPTTACVPDLSSLDDPAFRSLFVAWRVLEHPWSRSPIYTEGTVEPASHLRGDWSEAGSDAIWTFALPGAAGEGIRGDAYLLTITEDGYQAAFEATVSIVGPHRFLDLRYEAPAGLQAVAPEAGAETGGSPETDPEGVVHAVPGGVGTSPGVFGEVHVFFKLQAIGNHQMVLSPISNEWLKTALKTARVDVRHAPMSKSQVILEASTEELRAFVLRFADDPEAFPGIARRGPGFKLRGRGLPWN